MRDLLAFRLSRRAKPSSRQGNERNLASISQVVVLVSRKEQVPRRYTVEDCSRSFGDPISLSAPSPVSPDGYE